MNRRTPEPINIKLMKNKYNHISISVSLYLVGLRTSRDGSYRKGVQHDP